MGIPHFNMQVWTYQTLTHLLWWNHYKQNNNDMYRPLWLERLFPQPPHQTMGRKEEVFLSNEIITSCPLRYFENAGFSFGKGRGPAAEGAPSTHTWPIWLQASDSRFKADLGTHPLIVYPFILSWAQIWPSIIAEWSWLLMTWKISWQLSQLHWPRHTNVAFSSHTKRLIHLFL